MARQKKEVISIDSLDTEGKQRIRDAIKMFSDSLARMDSEREYQKNLLDDLSDKYGVDTKLIKKIAKVHHKSNFQDVVHENEEFHTSFETVFGHPVIGVVDGNQ